MMRETRGFTLIEMLISMAIFAVVAFLTMIVVTQALQYNAKQQATVAAQSKLRRVTEVIGQEVRSSVFGGVANAPYASNNTQLSFYLLEQGSGYTVASEAFFEGLSSFNILTENQPTLNEIILVDSYGDPKAIPEVKPSATIFPVSGIAAAGTDTWRINHASCTNGVKHNRYLQAFGVHSLGFRLDAASQRLMLSEDGVESPMAFGITKFEIFYIYTKQSGGTERRPTPFIDKDTLLPAKIYTTEAPAPIETYLLSELQITVSTEELGREKITRTYTGQIPLLISSNNDFKSTKNGATVPNKENTFNFSGVKLCN
jgi:prepilin-type N-terminal cleavage/methylation domain-containing protein